MVKMNDFNDLYVLFCNRDILYGASVASQRLFVFYLYMLHGKFYISERKQNESHSQMFHIFTKIGL